MSFPGIMISFSYSDVLLIDKLSGHFTSLALTIDWEWSTHVEEWSTLRSQEAAGRLGEYLKELGRGPEVGGERSEELRVVNSRFAMRVGGEKDVGDDEDEDTDDDDEEDDEYVICGAVNALGVGKCLEVTHDDSSWAPSQQASMAKRSDHFNTSQTITENNLEHFRRRKLQKMNTDYPFSRTI